MKLTREKPCQRRHHRLTAPLYISIGEQLPILVNDWSLGGVSYHDSNNELPTIYDELSITVDLPFQGFDISFGVRSKIVRVDESKKNICVEYLDLSERAFDLMNYFVEDLIRGKMGSIDDTICRIDVPVTPISTAPTPNPTETIPSHRLPIKTILMSLFYIIFGIFIFSYLFLLIYSSYFKLEVPTSVISSKVQTLKMPVEGIIFPINYEIGTQVLKGDELFRVKNTKITMAINSSKRKIITAENNLWEIKEKYRIENERMKLYQIVSSTDKKIIEAQLSAKRQELSAADSNFLRYKKLKDSGVISYQELNRTKQRQNKISHYIEELEAKLAQASAMESASSRRHYNHKEFTVDLDMMAVALQKSYSAVEVEKQHLSDLIKIQETQVVRAPYNGKITSLYQVANTTVSRNEPILNIEENGVVTVTSFLNQEEISQIGLNDQVIVFIPSLDLYLPAIVLQIDRNSLFIDKKTSRYQWKDKEDRTAIVSLELLYPGKLSPEISAGMPAVVTFPRRSANSVFSIFINQTNDKTINKSNRGSYDSI